MVSVRCHASSQRMSVRMARPVFGSANAEGAGGELIAALHRPEQPFRNCDGHSSTTVKCGGGQRKMVKGSVATPSSANETQSGMQRQPGAKKSFCALTQGVEPAAEGWWTDLRRCDVDWGRHSKREHELALGGAYGNCMACVCQRHASQIEKQLPAWCAAGAPV